MPSRNHRMLKILTRSIILIVVVVLFAMYLVGCIVGNTVPPKAAMSLPHWMQVVLLVCIAVYVVLEIWGMLSKDKKDDRVL